jgi:hypothetical protein
MLSSSPPSSGPTPPFPGSLRLQHRLAGVYQRAWAEVLAHVPCAPFSGGCGRVRVSFRGSPFVQCLRGVLYGALCRLRSCYPLDASQPPPPFLANQFSSGIPPLSRPFTVSIRTACIANLYSSGGGFSHRVHRCPSKPHPWASGPP